MIVNIKRLLFILVTAFIIFITILSVVHASPAFVDDDMSIYLNDGLSKSSSVVVYDVDGINLSDVLISVKPHPDYPNVPTFIRNIDKKVIDDYAVEVSFEVFLPSNQGIGIHREIMYLNNNKKLNILISNDPSFIAKIKDFSHSSIPFGKSSLALSSLFFILLSLLGIGLIFYAYRRFSH